MNRILLTILILLLPAGTLFSQQTKRPPHPPAADGPRSAPRLTESAVPGDTLPSESIQTPVTDSTGHYIPLWEPDTLVLGKDSVREYEPAPRIRGDTAVNVSDTDHSPSKAVMYALAFPGLGQGYNKKYWKIPIVWAAFGGAGYAVWFNGKEYKLASEEFAQNPDDDLSRRKLDYWRRYLELSYIALVGVYALQVVDAYVDAQLFSWDVNDNLSMKMTPSVQPLMAQSGIAGAAYGLSCCFTLKGK